MKRRKKNRKNKWGFFVLLLLVVLIVGIVGLRSVFPRPYLQEVSGLSNTYQMETALIYAVIHTESSFREDAQSPAGAKGLMQITEETGEFIAGKLSLEGYTSEDLFKPETNIIMGTYYLHYLMGRFSNQRTMLAAYNAGPNRVAQWLEDENLSDGEVLNKIPFEETKNYVDKVQFRQKVYELLYRFD